MRSHGPSDVSNGAATTEADLVSDGAARSRYSRHVRYASNTDRIDASQQNVAMCQSGLMHAGEGGRPGRERP